MKWNLHHVNLNVFDMDATRSFYLDALQLEQGKAHTIGTSFGDMGVDDSNLLCVGEENAGIHLLKPLADFAKRTGLAINPAVGGHTAIQVEDIREVIRRLDEAKIFYSYARDHAMPGIHQLYVYDPSGNLIEINQAMS